LENLLKHLGEREKFPKKMAMDELDTQHNGCGGAQSKEEIQY
jgi:hypothetical protein